VNSSAEQFAELLKASVFEAVRMVRTVTSLVVICSIESSIMSKQNGSPAKAPVHEVRLGRIKAAVWENTTENGVRHNVTISRLYKDGTQWKDSASFGRDDLPLVIKVADQAHNWIFNQSGSDA